ncbi:MAG: cytochrome c oxidase subunit 4 [Candidatus Eremiobacteraeota bacterium]|nr:cytochrome c oxidase subunit 4 [Candidatus Eremiobacteraeota bacterium]
MALLLISGAFGVAIAVAYWLIAHEETTGTALLGIMSAALFFAASYAIIAERNANLAGDVPEPQTAEAPEDLGIFTTHSPWPILVALCALGALSGVLWSPFLAVVSLCALLLCLWRLGRESAITPGSEFRGVSRRRDSTSTERGS